MNKIRVVSITSLLLLFSVMLSCKSSMTPLQAGEKFWLGIQKKNIVLINQYSSSRSTIKKDEIDKLPVVTQVKFGKIIIDGEQAEIETNLTIFLDKNISNFSVKTFLITEDDNWKVDYEKTMLPLLVNQEITDLFGGIHELAEGFAEEIEESVEDFKEKALPEIKSKLEQAEQELRQKLPELKNKIDEFLKDLEKSIEDLMPPKEEAKTQQT